MYVPCIDSDGIPPAAMSPVDTARRSRTNLDNDDEMDIGDVCGDDIDARGLSNFWAGETVFDQLLLPPRGFDLVCGRLARKLKTSRPGDVWPEIWQRMSQTQTNIAIIDWRVKSEKVNEARPSMVSVADISGVAMFGMLIQPKTAEESDPASVPHLPALTAREAILANAHLEQRPRVWGAIPAHWRLGLLRAATPCGKAQMKIQELRCSAFVSLTMILGEGRIEGSSPRREGNADSRGEGAEGSGSTRLRLGNTAGMQCWIAGIGHGVR